MRYDADVKAVLWASIEDFAGLWEVEWELNALHPNVENRGAARTIVEELLAAGMVRVFRSQSLDGELSPVHDSAAAALLRKEGAWEPAGLDSSPVWRIGATSEGETFYAANDAAKHPE